MDPTVGTALQQRTTYMNNSISTHVPENRKYATYKHTVGEVHGPVHGKTFYEYLCRDTPILEYEK